MSKKRVMAFFMHEDELAEANDSMPGGEATESYVLGELDDAGIAALREKGLIVQVVDDARRPGWARKVVDKRVASGLEAASTRSAPPDAFGVPASAPRVWVLELDRPLVRSVRQALAEADVEIIEAVGRNVYTAKLSISQKAAVDALPFVRRTTTYSQDTVEFETDTVESPAPAPGSVVPNIVTYELRLHRAEDANDVLQSLADQDIAVEGHQGRKIRLFLERGSALLPQVRGLPPVQAIDEWIEPELHNNRARVLLGIDQEGAQSTTVVAQTGAGQVVAVADTGIDQTHPDFPAARIAGVVARGRPPADASDPHGHGTHVAGSVLGDGAGSAGNVRGTAPDAKLFFQSIMDARGKLGGLPWDLNELFDEAYQQGARIHNNSWGANTNARYTGSALEVDEFVASHPDMLVVISAGNDGSARSPVNTSAGFVDWLSMGSPATSKNALTVGASQTDRTTGGYSALTWRDAWPVDFPEDPIGSELVSGDTDSMAAFSSRGPCNDQRIKPDVLAPGTDIVSARAATAPLRNFWGAYGDHGGKYAYMGGTSMAAPLVSGCAALVRQYYTEESGHQPSAALLKATLINGTRGLHGPTAEADHPHLPNYHQGFGCVHMPWTVPNSSVPEMRLAFRDTHGAGSAPLQATGDAVRYAVKVGDKHALRVCLAWIDGPARALQNNLNLFVEDPDGDKSLGNQDRRALFQAPDPDNNVEIVRIEQPKTGDYVIKISATNLLGSSGQHFALVVTGDLKSDLIDW